MVDFSTIHYCDLCKEDHDNSGDRPAADAPSGWRNDWPRYEVWRQRELDKHFQEEMGRDDR